MTPNHATLKIITGWLASLADVTSHGSEGRPSKDVLATYASLLGQDFPSSAFTAESLRYVIGTEAWWPAMATITKRIGDWWRDNRPASAPRIGYDGAAAMSDEDEIWVAFHQRRMPEIALLEDWRARAFQETRLLSLIKARSLPAWHAVTGKSPEVFTPPSPEMLAAIRALIEGMRSPDAKAQEFATRKPRDVSLKGEALQEVRNRHSVVEIPPHQHGSAAA